MQRQQAPMLATDVFRFRTQVRESVGGTHLMTIESTRSPSDMAQDALSMSSSRFMTVSGPSAKPRSRAGVGFR